MKKLKTFMRMAIFMITVIPVVMLVACTGLLDNSHTVTSNLPPLSNNYSRSISNDKIDGLKLVTSKYRVTFQSSSGETVVHEGTKGPFSATFPINTKVNVAVECLNRNGDVIVKSIAKTVIVGTGENKISFNLSRDGTAYFATSIDIKMISIQGGKVPLSDTYQPTVSNFSMSETEITQAQWKAVVGNDGYGTNQPSDQYGKSSNLPMYYVSWYDALVFCNKLSMADGKTPCYKINGYTDPDKWGEPPSTSTDAWNDAVCDWSANGYRLPTEAEWEYAARAGNTDINGDQYGTPANAATLVDYAWHSVNAESIAHGVGTKNANNFGMKDMSGNVWEWCWDWYGDDYDATTNNDPHGPSSGSKRVYRGGSWFNVPDKCAVQSRNSYEQNGRNHLNGFRVVCRQ